MMTTTRTRCLLRRTPRGKLPAYAPPNPALPHARTRPPTRAPLPELHPNSPSRLCCWDHAPPSPRFRACLGCVSTSYDALPAPTGPDYAEALDFQPAGRAVRSAYSGGANGLDANRYHGNADSSTDTPVWMTAMARQEATALLSTAGIEGGFVVRSSSNGPSGKDDDRSRLSAL